MLAKRFVSSVVLAAIVFVSVGRDWLFGLVVTLFIGMALNEFFAMLAKKGINAFRFFGLIIGLIIPLSIVFRFELTKGWELLFIICAFIVLILMQFIRRKNSGAVVDISTTVFAILYISWPLSFFIKIRYLENGLGLLLSVLLITKLGDIGAYLVGSRWGHIPLLPHISPKKTVEGALGGLFFSVLGAIVSRPFLHFGYSHLVLLGLVFAVLGQLGDLSESLIKRDCQLKDSGMIIPGMGGVLDLVDSLIFTGPAFYFYISSIITR